MGAQASRFVHAAAQLDFERAIVTVRAAQSLWEGRAAAMLAAAEPAVANGTMALADLAAACSSHATAAVAAWWEMSDELTRQHAFPADPYPSWWLQSREVGFADGPPPSPKVPPLRRAT